MTELIKNEWMHEWRNGWYIYEWSNDEWMNAYMNECTNELMINVWMS